MRMLFCNRVTPLQASCDYVVTPLPPTLEHDGSGLQPTTVKGKLVQVIHRSERKPPLTGQDNAVVFIKHCLDAVSGGSRRPVSPHLSLWWVHTTPTSHGKSHTRDPAAEAWSLSPLSHRRLLETVLIPKSPEGHSS